MKLNKTTPDKAQSARDAHAATAADDASANDGPDVAWVVKRDGREAAFDLNRISRAIARAGAATSEFDGAEAHLLARFAARRLKGSPGVEEIQDLVELTLVNAGYMPTARAYIVYREQHSRLREDARIVVDVESSINEYLERTDWRVNANANQGYSLGGLILNTSGKVIANYWLSHVYSPEIGRAHREGDLHIHDLDMLSGYCAGWSLRTLLAEGLNGVPGKIDAAPPKHFSSAVGQIVNFLGTLQNEWAGAQAFSSFDTYMAPYVRIDRMTYEQVLQCVQELVYNLNVPSRWGTQTPFTNLTFDWTCPEDLRDEHPVVAGVPQDFTYGELGAEMDMINRAYIEVMTAGDATGRVFTFPIPTYNITEDFPWESENAERLFTMTAKYGLPYFQNFINSELKPNQIRSMCCRLRIDNTLLEKRGGGLFGANPLTGSVGVVTINLPRIGYLSGTKDEFFAHLSALMDIAKESLEIKRNLLEKLTAANLYPYTTFYLKDMKTRFGKFWKNHFSTIGLVGMNEACINFLGKDITANEGKKFALEVLDFMRARIVNFQKETGNHYNLEATPAEGTSFRLAKKDKARFKDISAANENNQLANGDVPFYTNSIHVPVNFTDDLFEVLDHQDELQTKFTGGTVVHAFLGEKISDTETVKNLVRKIAENYKLPYYSLTPTFSVCPEHGYLAGEQKVCPHCSKQTEVYSRIVGYLRPVQQWNDGKQAEFKMRTPLHFSEK
jgi:ribonucleoside-triphosphate reductase